MVTSGTRSPRSCDRPGKAIQHNPRRSCGVTQAQRDCCAESLPDLKARLRRHTSEQSQVRAPPEPTVYVRKGTLPWSEALASLNRRKRFAPSAFGICNADLLDMMLVVRGSGAVFMHEELRPSGMTPRQVLRLAKLLCAVFPVMLVCRGEKYMLCDTEQVGEEEEVDLEAEPNEEEDVARALDRELERVEKVKKRWAGVLDSVRDYLSLETAAAEAKRRNDTVYVGKTFAQVHRHVVGAGHKISATMLAVTAMSSRPDPLLWLGDEADCHEDNVSPPTPPPKPTRQLTLFQTVNPETPPKRRRGNPAVHTPVPEPSPQHTLQPVPEPSPQRKLIIFDGIPDIGQHAKDEIEKCSTLRVDLLRIEQDGYSCAFVSARAVTCCLQAQNPTKKPPLETDELEFWKQQFGELKTNKRGGPELPTNHGVSDWCDSHGVVFEHRVVNLVQTVARAPPSSEPLVGILFMSLGHGGKALEDTGHFVAWCVPPRYRALPPPHIFPSPATPPREAEILSVD
eukprot:Hpha_TRINITY_DN15876_c0_g3::TRINITY_DN15876_c0_g3_i13::g.190947::m.190947